MAKMAYLIPIPRMRQHYRNRAFTPLSEEIPFVHHLNASFTYCPYQFPNEAIRFNYESRHDGYNRINRTVGITPYLLRYRIGDQKSDNFAIALIVTIDKYFHIGDNPIRDDEWCTPFDLAYLRRALCESGCRELLTAVDLGRQEFRYWLTSIISDVSGINNNRVDLSRIFSSSNIAIVGIDNTLDDIEDVNQAIRQQYYVPTNYRTIDDFLANNFVVRCINPNTTDARRFIHGFLHSNENFMQLHHNSVQWTNDSFYSNNIVEGYWATEDHILSVRIGSPFVNLRDDEMPALELSNCLTENDCFMELCVLGMLDREIERFNRNHTDMESHEIELHRAQISEYLNERILNVWEMDHRMDYFMNRFRLEARFKRLQDVVVPRGNARNVVFNRVGSYIGWVIAFLAMIATILTLLKD